MLENSGSEVIPHVTITATRIEVTQAEKANEK
jgi:hypothetical protein